MAAGSLAAAGLTRLMRKLLLKCGRSIPRRFWRAAAVLALIRRCWPAIVPARRATRVDPMTALRERRLTAGVVPIVIDFTILSARYFASRASRSAR